MIIVQKKFFFFYIRLQDTAHLQQLVSSKFPPWEIIKMGGGRIPEHD